MKLSLPSRVQHVSPSRWASLTLACLVTAGGAIAIANAEGTQGHPIRHTAKPKSCASSNPCLSYTNTGNGIAIFGQSTSNYALEGQSAGFFAAVGGYNTDSEAGASGVYGQSSNGYGVTGFVNSSTGYALYGEGNALVTGEIYTGGSCQTGCSRTRHQMSFVSRTTQPTTDDVGEATLRNGVAHVALAADFANTIDTHKPYVVLLTPEGDASLYVASRTSAGFEVRQVSGGRSDISFAYRIVAKVYGATDERLPFKVARDYSAGSAPR